MLEMKIHHEVYASSDGKICLHCMLKHSGELKVSVYPVRTDYNQVISCTDDHDFEKSTSVFPVSLAIPQKSYLLIMKQQSDKLNAGLECPADVMCFEISDQKDLIEAKIRIINQKPQVFSGSVEICDLSREIPAAVSDETLETRKKMASEFYYSDEGFAGEIMEKAMEEGLDEDKAMWIYQSGEKLAFKVAEKGIFLTDEEFPVYLNQELKTVRKTVLQNISGE